MDTRILLEILEAAAEQNNRFCVQWYLQLSNFNQNLIKALFCLHQSEISNWTYCDYQLLRYNHRPFKITSFFRTPGTTSEDGCSS